LAFWIDFLRTNQKFGYLRTENFVPLNPLLGIALTLAPIMMKKLKNIIAIIVSVVFGSCGPDNAVPISTFDSPFPKKNINLSNILGSQISLKIYSDTLSLQITANKDNNTIINRITNDTIFTGKICKYRGLYYFNEKLNDSSFWIYSVKIEDNLIYGFNQSWNQTLYVDSAIRNGKSKKLIKFINSDTSIISLHPEKHEMKKLFSNIIVEFSPDTIIEFESKPVEIAETKNITTEIDPEEFDNILKAYPNPTKDKINIELQQKNKATFKLIDLSGKTILQGEFNEIINEIDLSKQPSGIYALTIFNEANKQKETIKIMKTK
jgi:hypothetical protein